MVTLATTVLNISEKCDSGLLLWGTYKDHCKQHKYILSSHIGHELQPVQLMDMGSYWRNIFGTIPNYLGHPHVHP